MDVILKHEPMTIPTHAPSPPPIPCPFFLEKKALSGRERAAFTPCPAPTVCPTSRWNKEYDSYTLENERREGRAAAGAGRQRGSARRGG